MNRACMVSSVMYAGHCCARICRTLALYSAWIPTVRETHELQYYHKAILMRGTLGTN